MALIPSLLLDGNAEEIGTYYVDVFPDGKIDEIFRAAGHDGVVSAVAVNITINGTPVVLINGGGGEFNNSFSFQVICKDQEEVDYFWNRFVGDGGEEVGCGWCTDKFGFSWQITPEEMPILFGDPDPERARKAFEAMWPMKKIVIADIKAAMDA